MHVYILLLTSHLGKLTLEVHYEARLVFKSIGELNELL